MLKIPTNIRFQFEKKDYTHNKLVKNKKQIGQWTQLLAVYLSEISLQASTEAKV